MKKRALFLTNLTVYMMAYLCVFTQPLSAKEGVSAENNSKDNSKKSLANSAFVIETNEHMAAESLERISGKIDRGFSDPENTFKSDDHFRAGPFAKEKIEAKKQNNSSY